MTSNIYSLLYDLINQYVFGGQSLTTGSNAELICMLIASIGSVFVVVIPFIVVIKIVNIIMGR